MRSVINRSGSDQGESVIIIINLCEGANSNLIIITNYLPAHLESDGSLAAITGSERCNDQDNILSMIIKVSWKDVILSAYADLFLL